MINILKEKTMTDKVKDKIETLKKKWNSDPVGCVFNGALLLFTFDAATTLNSIESLEQIENARK
jgi:hypothetical protein